MSAWKAIVVGAVVAVVAWFSLSFGASVYQDWAFLHIARLATEQQNLQNQVQQLKKALADKATPAPAVAPPTPTGPPTGK